MALPRIVIDVGFTSTGTADVFTVGDPTLGQVGVVPLGAPEIWTTLPDDAIRSWSIKRGAGTGDAPTLRYDPGTATVELNDGHRYFDPENLDGPYVSAGVTQIEAMRRVRFRAVWDDITYPLFYGYADDWDPDYQGNTWTYTLLTATDGSVILNRDSRTAVTAVGAGEDSGARATRILDSCAWPAGNRLISVGDTKLQATTLDGAPLTELQLVQDTEQGEFYLDAQGRAVFRNRRAMLTEDRSNTSQATFGDSGWKAPTTYDFESGVADWFGVDATISASTSIVHSGAGALLMTVVGSPSQSYTRPLSGLLVIKDHEYTVTTWAYLAAGGDVGGAIDWFDFDDVYQTSNYSSNTLAAATWTQITVTATAPVTGRARFGPVLVTPTAGTQLYLDDVVWTDLDPEIPYADAKVSTPGDTLVNSIDATAAGGTLQHVEDTVSVARFGPKTHQRDDLLMQTDTAALAWANWLKYQYATPARRFSRIEFNTPALDVEDLFWPAMLGREFGDRITVIRRPAGGGDPIVRDCFVRGIEHASDGAEWKSALILQGADRYSFFVVGDAILGRVGYNAVAY